MACRPAFAAFAAVAVGGAFGAEPAIETNQAGDLVLSPGEGGTVRLASVDLPATLAGLSEGLKECNGAAEAMQRTISKQQDEIQSLRAVVDGIPDMVRLACRIARAARSGASRPRV